MRARKAAGLAQHPSGGAHAEGVAKKTRDIEVSRLFARGFTDARVDTLKQDEPQDLYEVIRHRYERGAMIIPSNRSTEEWYPLFGDQLLASAAMDRLLHHCHVVELKGDSYRNPKNKR